MKNDYFIELQNLRLYVWRNLDTLGWVLLSGNGNCYKHIDTVKCKIVKAADDYLPIRVETELDTNLWEATDKRQIIDTYRQEVEKGIIGDDVKKVLDRINDTTFPETVGPAVKVKEVLDRINDKVHIDKSHRVEYAMDCIRKIVELYEVRIIEPILKSIDDLEKKYLAEPQPQPEDTAKPLLLQITEEGKEGLKQYFEAPFKGMGNNIDRFNENLISALKQCQTKKDIAEIILACYNSGSLIKTRRPNSWNKWVKVWCDLFFIDGIPYKASQIKKPDYDVKYYWLKPPVKSPKNSR